MSRRHAGYARAMLTRREAMAWLACGAGAAAWGCRRATERARGTNEPGSAGELRLAAVSPAIAITLRDLGLESSIVGRHAWDMALDPAVPIVGDQASIDFEALVGVRPTHVLLEWGVREPPERLRAMASERGWLVRSWSLLSYAQVRSSIEEIAAFAAQGRPAGEALATAARAAALTKGLDKACAPVDGAAKAGRVLLLGSTNPPAALGPGSFHQEILERMGATPATATGGAYIQLHLEDLKALAPDAIVMVDPREPRGTGEGAEPGWDALAARLGGIAGLDIPAVRSRRVAVIDDPFSLTPSTALIPFAKRLAGIVGAWGAQGAG